MKIEQAAFIFTRDEMRALLAYASEDDPALAFVALDIANRRAYATDGHRIAVVHAEAPEQEPSAEPDPTKPIALSCADLEKVLQVPMSKYATIHVTLAGELRIVDPHGAEVSRTTITSAALDGTMPLWHVDRAYPFFGLPPPPMPRVCGLFKVTSHYLGALAFIANAAGQRRIDIYPGETPNDPILIQAGAWQVVLMPRRTGKPARAKKAA